MDYYPVNDINEEVIEYVKEFESFCPKKFKSKIIRLEYLNDDELLGYCIIKLFNPWKYKIILNKKYWLKATYYERKLLIFHELSHAIGQEHVLDKNHYMYPNANYIRPSLFYEQVAEVTKKYCYEH